MSTNKFDVHVTVHRDTFLVIKPTRCTNFSTFYFFGGRGIETLYVSDSPSVHHHCCVYSEKLLEMDRGTVRNMWSFNPKIKFEKLVHLVGFMIRK
jgi:hypothetical protein